MMQKHLLEIIPMSQRSKERIDEKSVAVTGLTIEPRSYRDVVWSRGALLRVHNCTDDQQHLPASSIHRNRLGESVPESVPALIDDERACKPVGWGQDGIRIEVLRPPVDLCPGGKRQWNLEDYRRFIEPGTRWRMQTLMAAVPPNPGSENMVNTMTNYLGFRRSRYRLVTNDIRTGLVRHTMVHIGTGEIKSEHETEDGESVFIITEALIGQDLGFIIPKIKTVVASTIPDHLERYIENIGCSGCVSLLQKIIRRMPAVMIHPDVDETYPVPQVIHAIVQRMVSVDQPGMFLPDQGQYVTALQHLLKRSFIILAEDSRYDVSAMNRFAGAALLASRSAWRPDQATVAQWVDDLTRAWRSGVTSNYKTVPPTKSTIVSLTPENLPFLALRTLGGMQGDLGMLWHVRDSSNRNQVMTDIVPSGSDVLDCCFDQHMNGCCCWLSTETIDGNESKVLQRWFQDGPGRNPRRHGTIEPLPSIQRDCFAESSRQHRRTTAERPQGTVVYRWQLHRGALAGMIGPVSVRLGSREFWCTVDPNDLTNVVAIPRPSRSSRLDQMTKHDQDRAIKRARCMFNRGVRPTVPAHSSFRHATLRFRNGQWFVGKRPWSEARFIESTVVSADVVIPTMATSYPWQTDACGETFNQRTFCCCSALLAGFSNVVTLPRVSRTGQGTKQALTGGEAQTYRLMRLLSQLYPDALWPDPKRPFGFITACHGLRQEIRRKMLNMLEQRIDRTFSVPTDDRCLRPQQASAVQAMLRQDQEALGNFLWMLVGSGKTRTALEFVHRRGRVSAVLWCLPRSATRTVVHEIRRFGWSVQVLVSSVGRKRKAESWVGSDTNVTLSRTLPAGVVTIVEHDDLRNLQHDLARSMPTCAMIFDEVHRAMAQQTKRTAAALALARIARCFVAMTGTPVVDSRTHSLQRWLALCVGFPVTGRNHWVAANAMVARLSKTVMKVREVEIEVPMTAEESDAIQLLLPPRLGGTAHHPDWMQAYRLSQQCCTAALVRTTYNVVYGSRGPKPTGLDVAHDPDAHQYACACTATMEPSESMFRHLEQRVLLVAERQAHIVELVLKLIAANVPVEHMYCIGGRRPKDLPSEVRHSGSVCITWESLERPKPRICIVPIRYCEGYSLTWMTALVTGVYPSNQARREQMRGRINRVGCARLHRTIMTLHAGITTRMLRYHRDAANLQQALRCISKDTN